MADVVDAATRSRMMANIRSKDTRPEIVLRRALHRKGLRFRLHVTKLAGRPDLVFPRFRAAVFVHGCFWHRHPDCRYATTPATRTEFWQAKFDANVARDMRNQLALAETGWRVGIVWECTIKQRMIGDLTGDLHAWLIGQDSYLEV